VDLQAATTETDLKRLSDSTFLAPASSPPAFRKGFAMTMSPTPRRDELHDGKPAWAVRLHDLKREFLQAVKSSRLQIVLVQSANGQDVRHLQPTADDRSRFAIARQNVSLPDGTPAWRFTYEIGKPNDPAKRLMERGDDILKAHGQEIFGLFGVPFIDSRKNWAWLLWQLKSIDHPYQGDIEAESTLAGVLPPNESQQVAAWTFGCGPKPDWYAERSRSFRVDLPHVTAASIAAIRAILARVGSAPRSASNAASKTSPEQPRETIASEVKPPKPKRKRRLSGQAKPLTQRQTEALKLHGECEGNIAEVARRMRIGYSTAQQHVHAGFKKLGKSAPTKAKTTQYKTDRRGQVDLTDSDERRG